MRLEKDVPIEARYLRLYTRVSNRRFGIERANALRWCSEHPERLKQTDSAALEELSALDSLPSSSAAFIQHSAYADIAPNRIYSAAFDLATPNIGSACTARLRLAIFWRKFPLQGLGDGHHHLVVFDFPEGLPAVLDSLRVDVFDGGVSRCRAALADIETWMAYRAAFATPQPDASSSQSAICRD